MSNRVTLDQIEGSIVSEHYFTALEGVVGHAYVTNEDEFGHPEELGLLTICVLRIWNGFTVLGKSACADPANFDAEIGKKVARQDAVNQMWPLLGYELKTNQALRGEPHTGEAVEAHEPTAAQPYPVASSEPSKYAAWCELNDQLIPDDMTGDEDGFVYTYKDGGQSWVAAQ